MERTGPRSSSPAAGAVPPPPNPPATIAGTERFIATAIMFVRIEPDAPTRVPATISAVLSSAIPVIAADTPVNALSSEMTTGMSAPPIGSTTMFPSTAAATRIPTMNSAWEWTPDASTTALLIATRAKTALMIRCPGSWIGRPGRISWSFPKAMFEPQNDTEPTMAANSDGICDFALHSSPPSGKRRRYSTQAISATAPPPTPLNSATICGIAVIRTFRAAGMPIAVPTRIPPAISATSEPLLITCWIRSVAMNAMNIPTAARRLPSGAVRGPARPRSPTMNSVKATM